MNSNCRCSKGPEGGGLRLLGTKTVFLKYTVVGEGMQKPKYAWFARELGRTKQPSWVSHIPDSSFGLPILISLIQEQTVAMLQRHQEGKNLAMRGHVLQKQNGLHSHVPQSL